MVLPDYGNYVVDIYRDGTLMPKYHIDFGNQALPEDKLPQTWKQFDKLEHTDDYFKSIVSVIEDVDSCMYVLLALRGRIMTFIGIRKQEK